MGAIFNWCSRGVGIVTALLVTPIVISSLGKPGFGMWALIQSFSGYYGLVNLGLGSALQRFFSRDLSLGDDKSVQKTVTSAIAFFTISGIVVMTAATLLSETAATFFNIDPNKEDTFSHVILLCAFAVVTDFFGAVYNSMLTSKERFDLANLLGVSQQVLQAIAIITVLQFSPTLYSLALVICVKSVIFQIIRLVIVKRLYPGISFRVRWSGFARIKELLLFGTSTVLITISNMLRMRIGNAVLAKTTGLDAVAIFNLATTIVQQMNSTIATSLSVLNPRLTHLHTQDQTVELQKLFRGSIFISSTMACFFGMLILVVGERFVLLWVGPDFLSSVPILHVLTVGYVFALAQNPSWNLMFALAKHHVMARIVLVETFFVIGIGIWLSRSYGAIGFAWATTGLMLVTKIFIHAPYAAHISNLSIKSYFMPMAFPFLIASILVGMSRILDVNTHLGQHGVIIFLLTAAAFSAVYGSVLLLISRKQDYFPESIFRRFTNKLGKLPGMPERFST